MSERPELRCAGCSKTPAEIDEYVMVAEGPDYAVPVVPDDYVWDEEGTLDRISGMFLCTACYIKLGQPSGPRGWKATPANMAALYGIDS